jgi:hypothetical protein
MRKLSYVAAIGLLAAVGCGAEPNADEDVTSVQAPLTMSKFGGWTPLPCCGSLTSGPAITSRAVGDLVVVARGGNNNFFINTRNSGGGWAGWVQLPGGGSFTSKPAVAAFPSNDGFNNTLLAVAGKGTDNKIYVNVQSGTPPSFTGNFSFSTQTFASAPALVRNGNQLVMVATDAFGTIFYSTHSLTPSYNANSWTAFTPISGTFFDDPALVAPLGGSVVLVAKAGDNMFYRSTFNATWTSFAQIPFGTFSSGPALSSWSITHVDVFGRGTDNFAWNSSSENGGNSFPSGFNQVPFGTFTSALAAVSYQTGHVALVGRGGDNNIWINTYQQ